MKAVGNNIIIIPEQVKTDKTKGGLLIIEKDREDIRYKKGAEDYEVILSAELLAHRLNEVVTISERSIYVRV